MTLVRITSLLANAIGRIDRRHTLNGRQDTDHLKRALKKIIPEIINYSLEYRNATLSLYSESGVAKHTMFINKAAILSSLKREVPHMVIKDIVFKGPRQ